MSDCASLIAQAGSGVAPTLRAVDCMTASASAGSFGHLLGPQGALAPALTAALTIYVAGYGLALMTGRARLGLGGLSGRMLALGLVLAFATTWAAYGPLVYAVTTRAPDSVAGAILGTRGSATAQFAARIDTVFAAVGDATRQADATLAERQAEAAALAASQASTPTAAVARPLRVNASQTAGFSPASVAMAGALVLMLSTVGVLVTARIALAVLLLVGPLFVVMALFAATRGLFAGWCRTLLLAAFAPMVVVLGGAFSLELAVPTVVRLLSQEGIDAGAATEFFLIATIHAGLMVMALRAAAGLVAGWRPWASAGVAAMPGGPRDDHRTMVIAGAASTAQRGPNRLIEARAAPGQTFRSTSATTMITRSASNLDVYAPPGSSPAGPRRAAGVGSRFRPASARQILK